MSQFDSAIISFTTKTDKVDLVQAAHMNAVQSELVIIETILGTNVKGNRTDLKTRLNNALDADGSILSGSAYPSPALPSMGFYRTDLDAFFLRNAANTAWLAQGVSLSNVLFQYQGQIDAQGTDLGEYAGTSLNPAGVAGNYRFLQTVSSDTNYKTLWTTKWLKTAGVNTITILVRTWEETASGNNLTFKVDVGGQIGTVALTNNQTTPKWYSFTIDVSGLTNLTQYDCTAYVKTDGGSSIGMYCSNIVAIGS